MIVTVREVYETPREVDRVLRLAGGLNRFGEPNFRCVWGWCRLAVIGGKFEDRDEHGVLIREFTGLRVEPKYDKCDRWHIERWLPPERYGSPEAWAKQTLEIEGGQNIPALGPYPSRGDYESCFILEDASGEFIQLTPSAARHIANAIQYGNAFTSGERLAAIKRKKDREDADYDKFADDVLSN
jgi:hypothetical protein